MDRRDPLESRPAGIGTESCPAAVAPLADIYNKHQTGSMKERREVYEQLIALRAILLRERQNVLARNVQNVLAILDERQPSSFNEAQEAWAAMMNFPRGLPDFGVWRENQEERFRLNAELDRYLQAISCTFGE
ncbi:hypothetical protein QH494_03415 [Sphingomonas sp. AR_OL41]|uniref:hypothetical protein n=1 Tax=Sphingomonas sp. AR_OL41 TaxID=3042729 RepID=UPI0024815E40|nr:hypothetical protein [Sphingomonas sp. AR_OL41]MDH7971219.1 hypothetical protein [Sphingomonas sp. AR_OL41]